MTIPHGIPSPLGTSPAFRAVMEQVSRLALLDKPILVIGERGTGKELVAARLHYLSPRWEGPFVKVNCAALSETLLESELFGHEAGAFTGAARRHPGRFELANGGSLFLDEIANASPRVQEKLLRVIEYGEFERVGGSATLSVDVRVIAATNADLPAMAAEGRFRPDLLDRLAFDVVTLPPLRARIEDVPLLAEHFAINMAREMGWPFFPGFADAALRTLQDHAWPGNVRELKNTVERAVARADTPDQPVEMVILDPFASPWRLSGTEQPPSGTGRVAPRPAAPDAEPVEGGFAEQVRAFEAGLLGAALERNRFNQKQAARDLGLTYHQFRNQLRKHGLLPGRGEAA